MMTVANKIIVSVALVFGFVITAPSAVSASSFIYLLLDKARWKHRKPTLYVFGCNGAGSCSVLRRYPAKYGLAEGQKRKQGDLKTPEGLYVIYKRRKNKRNTHFKYGPYSLWISYPNTRDKARGVARGYNPGYGITIHGGRAYKTEGCIRVLDGPNRFGKKNMTELATRFADLGTKMRITSGLPLKRRLRVGDPVPAFFVDDVKGHLRFHRVGDQNKKQRARQAAIPEPAFRSNKKARLLVSCTRGGWIYIDGRRTNWAQPRRAVVFSDLEPGLYTVMCRRKGFKASRQVLLRGGRKFKLVLSPAGSSMGKKKERDEDKARTGRDVAKADDRDEPRISAPPPRRQTTRRRSSSGSSLSFSTITGSLGLGIVYAVNGPGVGLGLPIHLGVVFNKHFMVSVFADPIWFFNQDSPKKEQEGDDIEGWSTYAGFYGLTFGAFLPGQKRGGLVDVKVGYSHLEALCTSWQRVSEGSGSYHCMSTEPRVDGWGIMGRAYYRFALVGVGVNGGYLSPLGGVLGVFISLAH